MSDLLNSASLVMIPSGYKEDVVYSQIPTDGSGDLSFTRASNGTRVNSAGLVEVAPWNAIQYSEDFANAVWGIPNGGSSVVVTSNATTAPNGTSTADKIEIANGTNDRIEQVSTAPILTSGLPCTFSCYIKSVSGTGKVGIRSGQSGVSSVLSYTNEWQRLTWTFNAAATNEIPQFCNSTLVFGADSAPSFYIWGAQLNIGSTAKPYFPTTDRLNVPRLTYQNGGGGCPSLLLEKQSTNLVTYSEQFDNAAWNKIQISATANNTTSPDGTQNADLITTTATGVCYTYELITGTSGAYSASIYAKNGNNNYLALNIQNSINNWVTSVFDLSDGSLGEYAQGSSGGIVYVNHTITPVGNGWYRCVLNYTTNQNSYYCPMFAPLKTGNSYTSAYGEAQSNANNKTIYLWGAQLEASSYATSLINTTSSSATRVADYTSRSGLALTNFTFAVNFKPLDYVVELFDFEKTGGGRMFYVAVQSNGFITFNGVSGGTIGAIGSVLPKNQTCKLAFSLNASTSNLKVYINGSIIGTYTTNITTFGAFFGLQSFGYNPGMQIEQIAIFPSVLTDAECQSLTT